MEKIEKEVEDITGWDYNSLDGEEKLLTMIENLVDSYKELEEKLADLEENVNEYGINYPSAEEEIGYTREW